LSFETQSSHQKILCSKMKLFEPRFEHVLAAIDAAAAPEHFPALTEGFMENTESESR
jgi:hypothetical protein